MQMPRPPKAPRVRVLPLCIAFLLCGCQSNQKHVSTAETVGAAGSWLVCLHNAAAALDDHVSEVSKIAPAVAERCEPAFDSGLETITRGMSPLKAALLRHKAARENLKLASAAVNEERLENKSRNSPWAYL